METSGTKLKRLRPESLYRRFLAYRQALGFEVVAAEAGVTAHRALRATEGYRIRLTRPVRKFPGSARSTGTFFALFRAQGLQF